MNRRISIVWADDAVDLLALYEQFLAAEPDMHCVATVPDAADLAAVLHKHKPDVLMMDLSMPGEEPIKRLSSLASAFPQVRILACTGYSDDETRMSVLDAGGWGLISKDNAPSDIVDAIRTVMRGEIVSGLRRGVDS